MREDKSHARERPPGGSRGRHRVAVVGAGISGLSAAERLASAGVRVVVFESGERPGGAIRTERAGGWLVEEGPNTVLDTTPRVAPLLEALRLDRERIEPRPEARRRYIVRDGRPHALPASPHALLRTPLLSLRGKLRALREPLVRARRGSEDESVADLVARRLGREVADRLLEPFVGGVYAGRADRLSARHAFPKLHALEAEHGGLLRGLRARARARRRGGETRRGGMFSFPDGLETLPRALAAVEGVELRTGTTVRELAPDAPAGWRVAYGDRVTRRAERFDAVVLAVPAHALPGIAVAGRRDEDLQAIAGVAHPPVAVLHLGYRREDVAHPLDGFGVLVPAIERSKILGALFPSSIFPGRAPDGHVLLAVFQGGTRAPDEARRPRDERVSTAGRELAALLGVRKEPAFVHDVVWERAIPQYELGYGRVLERMDAFERAHPGLFLTGSYRGGISVPDSLQEGYDRAGLVIESLRRIGEAPPAADSSSARARAASGPDEGRGDA